MLQPAQSGQIGRRWAEVSAVTRLFVVLLPPASVALLNIIGEQDVSYELRMVASAVCLLGWIPFVSHVLSSRRGLPFMPVFGLIFALYFVAPIFLLEKYYVGLLKLTLPDEVILRTEKLALVGLVAALAGYYLLPEGTYRNLPRLQIHLNRKRTSALMAVIGTIAALYQNVAGFLNIPPQFGALFTFLMQLASFSIALLAFYHFKGQLSRSYKIFLWGFLIPMKLLTSLSSGFLAMMMTDLLVLFGGYWLARQRYPWKTALVCFIISLPFWGLKGEFRQRAWSAEGPTTALGRGKLYLDLVVEGVESEEGVFGRSYNTFVQRTDMLTTFATVVYTTPAVVPYWEGESYATLYWMLIPRAFYPDKPLKTLGQDFGHRYGLLHRTDDRTSYNFPQIVELYANFGPVAVGLGMFLIGALYRIFYFVLAHPDAGDGGSLLALVVFSRLCNIESDFSVVFGGLVLNILALVVILRVFQTDYVRMPVAAFRWR